MLIFLYYYCFKHEDIKFIVLLKFTQFCYYKRFKFFSLLILSWFLRNLIYVNWFVKHYRFCYCKLNNKKLEKNFKLLNSFYEKIIKTKPFKNILLFIILLTWLFKYILILFQSPIKGIPPFQKKISFSF